MYFYLRDAHSARPEENLDDSVHLAIRGLFGSSRTFFLPVTWARRAEFGSVVTLTPLK